MSDIITTHTSLVGLELRTLTIAMVQVIQHRKVNLVHLDAGDVIAEHCRPGDIAIVAAADGWHLHFIARDGSMESYDRPYPSKNEALWAAKAAAEYGFS